MAGGSRSDPSNGQAGLYRLGRMLSDWMRMVVDGQMRFTMATTTSTISNTTRIVQSMALSYPSGSVEERDAR